MVYVAKLSASQACIVVELQRMTMGAVVAEWGGGQSDLQIAVSGRTVFRPRFEPGHNRKTNQMRYRLRHLVIVIFCYLGL